MLSRFNPQTNKRSHTPRWYKGGGGVDGLSLLVSFCYGKAKLINLH